MRAVTEEIFAFIQVFAPANRGENWFEAILG